MPCLRALTTITGTTPSTYLDAVADSPTGVQVTRVAGNRERFRRLVPVPSGSAGRARHYESSFTQVGKEFGSALFQFGELRS